VFAFFAVFKALADLGCGWRERTVFSMLATWGRCGYCVGDL